MCGIFFTHAAYLLILNLRGVLPLKNILIVAYSFAAALIGAGFASGGEILGYFVIFNRNGIWGIIFFAVFSAAFLYAVFSLCRRFDAHSFEEFLNITGSPHIARAIRLFTALFSFCVFSAMLSALGEGLAYFGIPPRFGAFFSAFFCMLLLWSGTDRALDFNGVIGLVLTAAVITCCLYILRYREYHTSAQLVPVFRSAAIYGSYNLCSAVPVLAVLSRRLKTRGAAAAAAFISSGAVLMMMVLMFCLLSIYYGRIPLGELPMLTLAKRQNPVFAAIYCAVIIAASATTLTASGSSILETFGRGGSLLTAALLCALGYTASGFGFSGLVNTAYRICGIAGIPLCVYIFYLSIYYQKRDFNSK